jgi:hypothetical protein
MSCREVKSKLETLPAIAKVDAWDGKDAAAPVDEIPLEDLMGEL